MIIESISSLRADALSRLLDSYRVYSQGAQDVPEEEDEESVLKESSEDTSTTDKDKKKAALLANVKKFCTQLLSSNKSLSTKYNKYAEKLGINGNDDSITEAAQILCDNLLSDNKIAKKYNNYVKKYLGIDPTQNSNNNSSNSSNLNDEAPKKEFV